MKIKETKLLGLKVICPKKIIDERGYFTETFRESEIEGSFVQDNQSLSKEAGTLRGLHYQIAPFAQAKLIRVIQGAIFDVAVDIREESKTFGEYLGVRLDGDNGEQLLVPEGFAHGFLTLEPNTIIAYKVSNYYSKEHDRGICWNDPTLDIKWPIGNMPPILSDKDKSLPFLKDIR